MPCAKFHMKSAMWHSFSVYKKFFEPKTRIQASDLLGTHRNRPAQVLCFCTDLCISTSTEQYFDKYLHPHECRCVLNQDLNIIFKRSSVYSLTTGRDGFSEIIWLYSMMDVLQDDEVISLLNDVQDPIKECSFWRVFMLYTTAHTMYPFKLSLKIFSLLQLSVRRKSS